MNTNFCDLLTFINKFESTCSLKTFNGISYHWMFNFNPSYPSNDHFHSIHTKIYQINLKLICNIIFNSIGIFLNLENLMILKKDDML